MFKKILIVDDEPLIVKGLKFSLEQDGYRTVAAYDGEAALKQFEEEKPDLILLDVMLPGVDGLEVCRMIRESSNVPIIMITAKGEDMDKILGLEYGADDYISKPFNVLEVKARIKNIFRRLNQSMVNNSDIVTFKNMVVDYNKRLVTIRGNDIKLTAKEFEILHLLMSRPGVVLKREDFMQHIWNGDPVGDIRTVDVHIRRLRKKVETNTDDPEYIFTKWGVGYYFAEK